MKHIQRLAAVLAVHERRAQNNKTVSDAIITLNDAELRATDLSRIVREHGLMMQMLGRAEACMPSLMRLSKTTPMYSNTQTLVDAMTDLLEEVSKEG